MSETLMILFMGQTGSGKSWLIHAITDSKQIKPSNIVDASTPSIEFEPWNHNGTPLLLIEVPGFDNTAHKALSNTEILTVLTTWLADSCPDCTSARVRIAWVHGEGQITSGPRLILRNLQNKLNATGSTLMPVQEIRLEHRNNREAKKYAGRKLDDLLSRHEHFVPFAIVQDALNGLNNADQYTATGQRKKDKSNLKRKGLFRFLRELFQ